MLTTAAESGRARIAVLPEVAPFGFAQHPLLAGTAPSTCVRLRVAGIKLRAFPNGWRFGFDQVPRSCWQAVGRYQFEDNVLGLRRVSACAQFGGLNFGESFPSLRFNPLGDSL